MRSEVAFEDVSVAGFPVSTWVDIHGHCVGVDGFGALRLREWPDGRPYLEQPAVTVSMFDEIDAAIGRQLEREAKRERRG